jgi:hypothetical protein
MNTAEGALSEDSTDTEYLNDEEEDEDEGTGSDEEYDESASEVGGCGHHVSLYGRLRRNDAKLAHVDGSLLPRGCGRDLGKRTYRKQCCFQLSDKHSPLFYLLG